MKLLFWGTRGSIPQPSYETLEFGGNTICTQLFYNEKDESKYFILDMGTGLIEFSEEKTFKDEYHIFISSFYWDYILGLPFFFHIHRPNVKIFLYSAIDETLAQKNIESLFDGTYSPLENINRLSAKLIFEKIPETGRIIDGMEISTIIINKTSDVSAIKIKGNGKTFVYAGNFEIDPHHRRLNEMKDFIYNADMFICDAQYTEGQYIEKKGWGHSKIENAIDLATKGNVKNCLLFHHDPFNADNFLKGYLANILRSRNNMKGINIDFAKQGKHNIIQF